MFELIPYRRNNYTNIFREMEELERRFFGEGAGRPAKAEAFSGFRTDVSDQGDSYLLEADMPGFDKESIHLDVENDVLTISAERHSEHENEEKKGSYVCCERTYGKYQRSFDVSGIDVDGIKAKYADGVLAVTLPKLVEVKPAAKAIAIE